MPSAIRHDHELSSKGLVSILMERQGSNEAQLESFMWQRFPENDCYVCIGGFVPTPPSSGIPHGALIGVDGKLLWSGNPLSGSSKVSELVDEQLKLIKKGWGDTATARTICFNPMVLNAETKQLLFVGLWYEDALIRTPEGWRMTRRVEVKCFDKLL